jgi:hypothetical protein
MRGGGRRASRRNTRPRPAHPPAPPLTPPPCRRTRFIDESEFTAAVEELVAQRQSTLLFKRLFAAVLVLNLLLTAAVVGCVWGLTIALKDTKSAGGALVSTDSGLALRTGAAELAVEPPPADYEALAALLPGGALAPGEFAAAVAAGGEAVPAAALAPGAAYDGFTLPRNLTALAQGVRVLGRVDPAAAARLCAFFDEGHKEVTLTFGSHGAGVARKAAELFSTIGCGGESPVFSLATPDSSAVLACEPGRGCALVEYTPLDGGEDDVAAAAAPADAPFPLAVAAVNGTMGRRLAQARRLRPAAACRWAAWPQLQPVASCSFVYAPGTGALSHVMAVHRPAAQTAAIRIARPSFVAPATAGIAPWAGRASEAAFGALLAKWGCKFECETFAGYKLAYSG